jgi:hypothetical protein
MTVPSESESELLHDWRFTANQFVLATSPWDPRPPFFFQLNPFGYIPYVTSSLPRGWFCHLQLLPILASTVIFGSESRGTHDHFLLSQIRDSLNLEEPGPRIQVKSKSNLCYDRRSVGQSILVSITHLRLKTRVLLLSDSCGFLIWSSLYIFGKDRTENTDSNSYYILSCYTAVA